MSSYAPTDWVDGITPLDAAHMDNMEAGIAGAVEKDSEVVAGARLVANRLIASDSQPAFRILGDGKHEWGVGGSSAPTVTLYKDVAGVILHTNAGLRVDGSMSVAAGLPGQVNIIEDQITLRDASLYRNSANSLATPGVLMVGPSTGRAVEIGVDRIGGGQAAVNFGSTADTHLFRRSAGELAIDNALTLTHGYSPSARQARNSIEAWLSSASLITIGEANVSDGNPAITMYRTSAGGAVGTGLRMITTGTDGMRWQFSPSAAYGSGDAFGSDLMSIDSGGVLRVTGAIMGKQQLVVNEGSGVTQLWMGNWGGIPRIFFGSDMDTSFWRRSAKNIETEASFWTQGSMVIGPSGYLWFNNAADGNYIFYNGSTLIGVSKGLSIGTDLLVPGQIATDSWATTAVWGPGSAGKFRLHGGFATGTTDVNGQFRINYGRTFTNVLSVVVTNVSSAHLNVHWSAVSPDATGFTLTGWTTSNVTLGAQAFQVYWMAFGY